MLSFDKNHSPSSEPLLYEIFEPHLETSKGKSAEGSTQTFLYPGIIQHPMSHLHLVIMTAFNMIFLSRLEI